MQLKSAPKRSRELLRRQRQLFRPHVVRRRIDEVARQRRRVGHARDRGDVDAVGRHQFDLGRIRLAVAAEAIAAEREGKRGEARIMWRVGKTIDARRQQAGQLRRAGTDRGICRSRPPGRTRPGRCLPSAAGSVRHAPGFGRKAVGQRELPGLAGKAGADRRPMSPWSRR